jgi:hypothetical protein
VSAARLPVAWLLAVAALTCAPGCSGALYSTTHWKGGEAMGEATLPPHPPTDKAEVLAAFGPPSEVLPLPAGDVFVYLRRLSNLREWNLNTGLVTATNVPLYVDVRGRQDEHRLFVHFDERGRVVELSASATR